MQELDQQKYPDCQKGPDPTHLRQEQSGRLARAISSLNILSNCGWEQLESLSACLWSWSIRGSLLNWLQLHWFLLNAQIAEILDKLVMFTRLLSSFSVSFSNATDRFG